jgi:hypothetical protein
MKNHHRIRELLEKALPSVGGDREPARDLWPELRCRIEGAQYTAPSRPGVAWFDWVLGCGVALVAIAFPVSIPVLLYYL